MMYQDTDITRKSLNLFKLLEFLIQKFQGITPNLLITKRKYFNSTLSIITRLRKFQREYIRALFTQFSINRTLFSQRSQKPISLSAIMLHFSTVAVSGGIARVKS